MRYSTARYLLNAVSGIGADSSPRGNHFTAYNFDAHDVTLDSPLTSFATMNPATTGVVSAPSLLRGKYKSFSSQAYNKIFTTHSATSKYYAEAMVHSNGFQYMGVAPEAYVANVDDFTGYLTQNGRTFGLLYIPTPALMGRSITTGWRKKIWAQSVVIPWFILHWMWITSKSIFE